MPWKTCRELFGKSNAGSGCGFLQYFHFFIDLTKIFLKYLLPKSDLRIEWECPMVITDFRVQSVLRTYTRQLQRSKLAKVDKESGDSKQSVEKVSISDEGKRRLMMERLTSQVLEQMYSKQDEVAGPEE
jgi:hypothetical protein